MATDLVETRPRFVKGAKYIRNAAVSPSGARAVFEFRGEIVTVPAEKGDPRNLTESPGVHERSPAWSPDGKSIAYFSDEGGEYRLHVRSADGKGKAKILRPQGGRLLREPASGRPTARRSPTSTTPQSLFWIDLEQRAGAEDRLGAALPALAAAHAAAGLVARLEVDRLRAGQQGRVSHGVRL